MTHAANEPAYHPTCDACQSVWYCMNNGCIPITRDEVEPAVERAIADLCNAEVQQ